MAEEQKTLEQVQAAQADPNDVPKGKDAPSKDPVTGKFLQKDGQDGKPEDKGPDHFKNLRKEVKEAQRALKERDAKIQNLETRMETLLDVVERRVSRTAEPEVDILSHLPKDDPDRPLIDRKVKPILDNVLKGTKEEMASLKAEIKRLQDEREAEKGQREQYGRFQSELRDWAEDREIPPVVSAAVSDVIAEGRVSGKTYEEAFDNALVYLKGAGKMPAAGAKGKEAGDERTSVGGVMPGQAGAPVSSDDYRVLRKQYAEARADGDGEAEARAFQNLLRKVQEEQGR